MARACRSSSPIAKVDLFLLAINQKRECRFVRLTAGAVQEELHQVGGPEKRTWQMVHMHGDWISRTQSTVIVNRWTPACNSSAPGGLGVAAQRG